MAAGPGARPGDRLTSTRARSTRSRRGCRSSSRSAKLPQKLFLIHQFTNDMVDDTQLQQRAGPGDGAQRRRLRHAGAQEGQVQARSRRRRGAFFGEGFKLFYREDTKLMTPRQVLRLRPPPDVVVYE